MTRQTLTVAGAILLAAALISITLVGIEITQREQNAETFVAIGPQIERILKLR